MVECLLTHGERNGSERMMSNLPQPNGLTEKPQARRRRYFYSNYVGVLFLCFIGYAVFHYFGFGYPEVRKIVEAAKRGDIAFVADHTDLESLQTSLVETIKNADKDVVAAIKGNNGSEWIANELLKSQTKELITPAFVQDRLSKGSSLVITSLNTDEIAAHGDYAVWVLKRKPPYDWQISQMYASDKHLAHFYKKYPSQAPDNSYRWITEYIGPSKVLEDAKPNDSPVSLFGNGFILAILWLVVVCIAVWIATLPVFLAARWNHRHLWPIVALHFCSICPSLFFGSAGSFESLGLLRSGGELLSGGLWLGSLIWSLVGKPPQPSGVQ